LKLLGLDIDGCLTEPESKFFNLEVLQILQQLNETAEESPDTPRVFFCSGRPHGFVEALMRVCACRVPSVFENGTGLVMPPGLNFRIKPLLPKTRLGDLKRLYRSYQRWVEANNLGRPVPGKVFTLSFYPEGELTTEKLAERIEHKFGRISFEKSVKISWGPTSVDLIPLDVDKSLGVKKIAELEDVPLTDIWGIGDASNDLEWLRIAGKRGVPSDAAAVVKDVAHTIASTPNVKGVLEILNSWFPQTSRSKAPS
jgi:HAD superfamily hydrolase (TIGR01484 family)